ncbi:MAG: VTC domain-containing protein [Chloroflexota bacterium]
MKEVVLDATSDVARRFEHRFLVNEAVARLALRTSGTYLPLDRDDRPYQWSTTAYLDTYDWRIFRAAEAGRALQLRVREYHRTRPSEIFAGGSVYFEMKDDSASTSFKERYEVPTMSLPEYLRGEQKLPRDENGLVERADRSITDGVRPVVVTQYNRIAYSAPDGSMRITADHNLMYLAVPWVANVASSMPCRVGPVIAREPGVIIEVKWFKELPRWADELYSYIKDHMVNERPSKFVVALRHLLGEEQTGLST